MPAPAEEPLRRCHMMLFQRDVAWLETTYGRGWSEQVRLLVRKHRLERSKILETPNLLRDCND